MKPSQGARVLLLGCGQMGSRHLQAVSTLPHVDEIEVVDPSPEAQTLGRQRLTEVPDRRVANIRWLPSLAMASRGGGLCIVATKAQGRCRLVREVSETLGYASFLLEKLVERSMPEVDALLEFSRERRLSVWVNCQSRAYAFHKRVKQRLHPDEPLLMSVIGGNSGLVTNGVHNADLFAYYDGATEIKSGGWCVDPKLHATKRGQDVFDLSGTLQAYTQKGSHLTLSYASDHSRSEQITVTSRRYRCIVDHLSRWAVESDADTGWAWRDLPFTENVFVSQLTKRIATDILTDGRCDLPRLEEAQVAHRFILNELQPHFSRLLEREMEECPVT